MPRLLSVILFSLLSIVVTSAVIFTNIEHPTHVSRMYNALTLMSSVSREEFETARKILYRYYDTLMEQVAEDIIRQRDEFEKGTFGNADDILEKHHCRLARLAGVYANLRGFASNEKPKGTKPLGKDEFRCFGCGHVIGREEDRCSLCGWTWR